MYRAVNVSEETYKSLQKISTQLNKPKAQVVESLVKEYGEITEERQKEKLEKFNKEMGEKLGRPAYGVANVLTRFHLIKINKWSREDINFLKSNYHLMTSGRIALKLNRKRHNVQSYAYAIGLRKKDKI